jgi:leucyl aminopeptidase
MKKTTWAPVLLGLWCATAAAQVQVDRDVWITLGAEALEPVQAAFWSAGQVAPLVTRQSGNVVALRVRESQLGLISGVMHDKFNRCAGFLSHDTEQQAEAALVAAQAPPSSPVAQVAYTIDSPALVNGFIPALQEPNIRSTITTLSSYTTRHYTSQTGVDAAHWIKNQWQSFAQGRSDVTVELFTHTWAQPSVILTIQGSTVPGDVVVIGGHLDSINSSGSVAPGADDDASGIATLTEVLRVALAQNYKPARTVKFMAYAAEEVGLKGSQAIATAHKNAGVNVVGVLQLDMTNYRGSSVDVGLMTDYTNAEQNTFVTQLLSTYAPGVTWANSQCGYGCSDHASWNSQGYPASMPFEALMNQRNPYIHTTNDTLAQSAGTAEHALKFAKLAAAFLGEMGKGMSDNGTGGTVPPPPPQPPKAAYDATLKAPKCATVGFGCDSGTLLNGRAALGPEANAPNTVNGSCADGTSGSFHSDESNDRLTVTTEDGTNLAVGKTVKVEATVWAYSASADKLDLYHAADATNPTWTLIGTLSPPGTGSRTLSATYTLPAGSLQAVRARFRYQGTAGPCTTGSYDDHDDLVFAVGGGDSTAPTASVTAPTAGTLVSGTTTISAAASDNVGVTKVEFFVDGMLKGTDTTAPYSYAWDSTSALNASHVLVAKAYDAAGNVGTSASVQVTVSNTSSTTAVFDATLKAPKCATVGSVCDSGTLLNGRGALGPEVNRPNTLNAACADGTSGAYHSDESNDRLKVSTLDGTALKAGKTVKVEATVWAYSTSTDKLDLYSTASATNPVWTLIGTLTPAGTGAQTLSATYTLPAGNLQAVRARFRYNGTAGACGTGAYDDHDDLVFAVSP